MPVRNRILVLAALAIAPCAARSEETLLVEAEALLARVLAPDHRLMIINNIGKSGGVGRTLKFVLRLRTDQVPDQSELIPEFIKHLIPARRPPAGAPAGPDDSSVYALRSSP